MRRLFFAFVVLFTASVCFVVVGNLHWQTTQAGSTDGEEQVTIMCSASGAVVSRYVKVIDPLFKEGTGIEVKYYKSRMPVMDQLLKEKVDWICLMRPLTDVEKLKELKEKQVGWDAYALIVNERNECTEITTEELRNVCTGQIKKWDDLGGPAKRITFIAPPPGSELRDLLDEKVLLGEALDKKMTTSSSDGFIIKKVQRSRYAIGFVSIDKARKAEGIKILPIDETLPIPEHSKYPFRVPIMFVTCSTSDKATSDFFKFCLSPTGQEYIARRFLPLKAPKK